MDDIDLSQPDPRKVVPTETKALSPMPLPADAQLDPKNAPKGTIETTSAATGLRRGAPRCVHETYALLCRELSRKQGMVEDLNRLAVDNYGLTPEDCDLLRATVRDRDAMKHALAALEILFN